MDVADSIINQSDDICNAAVDDAVRLEGTDSLSYDLRMDSQLRAGSTVQRAGKQVWGRGQARQANRTWTANQRFRHYELYLKWTRQ